MRAVQKGDLKTVQDLIQNDADLLMKNNKGQDAYSLAMKNGHIEVAKVIKEAVKEKMKRMVLKKVSPRAFSSLMKASMQKERE
jgi:ankyrin repeat protein